MPESFAQQVTDDGAWCRITHASPGGGWSIEVEWPDGTHDNGVERTRNTRVRGDSLDDCMTAALADHPTTRHEQESA